ncbi:polysaccharide deacetylase family protein [Rhodobium gokarnense]|nr:polysaccharide deacetylase family protein [Rhodobium gokarnense]
MATMAGLSKRDAYKAGLNALYFTGTHRLLAPFTQGLGAILMLHRVAREPARGFSPNAFLEISPDYLIQVLEYLRAEDYDIVALDEVPGRLQNPDGRRFVAITFDDGFRDNYEIAYPILKRYGAPFTVFVASAFADRTIDLWWVALERIVAHSNELTVALHGRERSFECARPADKMKTFDTLQKWLTMTASEDEQRETIRRMAERADLDLAEMNAELAMTWGEIRELSDDPIATIGAHTVNHYAVARLDADRAREEIIAGADRIARMTGKRPEHFAYPYGSAMAAGPRDFEIVRDLGFKTAVTTRPGLLYGDHVDHMTALPRVSLNGEFQAIRYLDILLTGGPLALNNGFRRLNVA